VPRTGRTQRSSARPRCCRRGGRRGRFHSRVKSGSARRPVDDSQASLRAILGGVKVTATSSGRGSTRWLERRDTCACRGARWAVHLSCVAKGETSGDSLVQADQSPQCRRAHMKDRGRIPRFPDGPWCSRGGIGTADAQTRHVAAPRRSPTGDGTRHSVPKTAGHLLRNALSRARGDRVWKGADGCVRDETVRGRNEGRSPEAVRRSDRGSL